MNSEVVPPSGGARPMPEYPSPDELERTRSQQEDHAWVEAILAGDRDTFDRLYVKHRDRVFGILRRVLTSREDALEATQEVFIKVFRKLHTYQPERAQFTTWLYKVGLNTAIDRLRYRQRRPEQEFDGEYMQPRGDRPEARRFPQPDRELEQREVRSRVERALAELPDKHREVFVLYSYEGLEYAEIARIVDIPIGTVMSRLYHARRKLQALLPPEWDPGGRRRREKRSEVRDDGGRRGPSDE